MSDKVENPKVVPIFYLKFKIPLLTELSVEGSIIRYNEEYSRIQKKKNIQILHCQQTRNYYKKVFPLAILLLLMCMRTREYRSTKYQVPTLHLQLCSSPLSQQILQSERNKIN